MSAPHAPSRLAHLRARLLNRFGRSGVALLAVMTLLMIGGIIFAIEGEKPWGRTVQKRLEKQQALQPKEYAVIGLWWAAVINAGLLAVLLGTAGKWMPPASGASAADGQAAAELPKERGQFLSERWIMVLVTGAVLFGTWERWPKLWQSYWNDEEYAIRRFVHGSWEKQKDGKVAFEPVTWTDTLFENRNGNNHLLNSLITRASLGLWRTSTGQPQEAFSEPASRLPHLIAGLASIVVVFLLGRECGSTLAGIGAAWLLAMHPWHIRYAVEMRGYALMLFFVALALLALARAFRTNRLRWWLLFAVSEGLFLASFPGSLYVAVALNAVAGIELLCRREWGTAGRLLAFNTLGAVPIIQWMLPSVPQLLLFLKEEQPAYVTDVQTWLYDLASVLAVGWQYDNPWREEHVGADWKGVAAQFPVSPPVLAGILGLLFVSGLLLALFKGRAARLIILSPVLGALISLVMNLRPGSPMTVWYLIYILIPASLAVNLALEQAGRWRSTRWLPVVLVAWFTIRYGMGTASAVASLRDHDRQPLRQTIAFINEQSADRITGTFGVSDRQSSTYDPGVELLLLPEDLEKCIARSRAEMKPLYVYYCSDDHGLKRRPEIYNRVTKSGEFEKLKEFPGSEELFSYRVYRLKTP